MLAKKQKQSGDTGELLEKTEQETNDHQAGEILNEARAKHDNTPAEDQKSQVL